MLPARDSALPALGSSPQWTPGTIWPTTTLYGARSALYGHARLAVKRLSDWQPGTSTLTTLSVCSLTIRPPDVPGTEQPDAEPQAGEPGVQRGGHETHDRVRSQEEQVLDANGHPGHRGLRNGLLLVQEAASAALAADLGAGSGRPAEGVGQRNRSSNVPVIRYPDGPAVHGLINGAGLLFGPVRDLIASVGPWPGWPGGREPTRHFFIPEGVGHRQTFLPHSAALATRATWRATSSLPHPLEWVWVLRGRA